MSIVLGRICRLCLFDVGGHRPLDEDVVCVCLMWVGIVLRRICGFFLFDVGGHRLKTNLWFLFV